MRRGANWGVGLVIVAAFATPAFCAMTAEVSAEALTVRGIAPNSSVALLSCAREPSYYMARVVSRHEMLVDDDGDAIIRYQPAAGIAFQSIWIVVDVASGESGVATRAGSRPLPMRQRGAGRGKAVDEIGGTLDVGRDRVDLLVVRRSVGAWSIVAHEGTGADRDGADNGRLRLDVGRMRPLSPPAGPPPQALQKGDVVAVIDCETLEYALLTIAEGGR